MHERKLTRNGREVRIVGAARLPTIAEVAAEAEAEVARRAEKARRAAKAAATRADTAWTVRENPFERDPIAAVDAATLSAFRKRVTPEDTTFYRRIAVELAIDVLDGRINPLTYCEIIYDPRKRESRWINRAKARRMLAAGFRASTILSVALHGAPITEPAVTTLILKAYPNLRLRGERINSYAQWGVISDLWFELEHNALL